MPAANCFAELVIAREQDGRLGRRVAPPRPPADATSRASSRSRPFWPPRCATRDRPFGVVGIYSRQKQEWTAEQFRLAEWLAAQCAHILETLRLQAELRRLYAEQQTIFNSVPAMIWYKDTKNNFIRVNRAVALSVGKPLDAIEGKSAYEVFPDEAEHYYQDDLEVINSGQPKLGIVEEMGTASGEKRWVQTDKIPYRDEGGDIIGVLVLTVDITERKRAEEAVRRSQRVAASHHRQYPGTHLREGPGRARYGCQPTVGRHYRYGCPRYFGQDQPRVRGRLPEMPKSTWRTTGGSSRRDRRSWLRSPLVGASSSP